MRNVPLTLLLILALTALPACGKKEAPVKVGGTEVKKPAEAGPDRLAEALVKAKEEGKNLLVEYYDRTCNFCTQMDKEVYPDDFVQELLGYVVYLRLERGRDGKPFEARWPKKATPTFVVLKPDGTQVGEAVTGFLDVEGFTEFVDWAANAEGDMPGVKPGGS